MTQAITLPLWIFIGLLALALLAALQWLLRPSVRGYFRRKVRGAGLRQLDRSSVQAVVLALA